MARINNDNQENKDKLFAEIDNYYEKVIPHYRIVYEGEDFGESENFEILEMGDLKNKIQKIYDNPQDYTDYVRIIVYYIYECQEEDIEAGKELGWIKGTPEEE
jgi:hypothetical protein